MQNELHHTRRQDMVLEVRRKQLCFTITVKEVLCDAFGGMFVGGCLVFPTAPIIDKYGMPGSGFPRCSEQGDVFKRIQLRLWANRELGDSFVASMTSDQGTDDFIFQRETIRWKILLLRAWTIDVDHRQLHAAQGAIC
jgi:hypothetical protein